MNARKYTAFTLSETMISVAVFATIMAGMMAAVMFVQRGFSSGLHYSERQMQQLRFNDYLARDLRGALSVSISADKKQLTIEVPDYYDPATEDDSDRTNDIRIPQIVNDDYIEYGTAAGHRTIKYIVADGTVTRTSDQPHDNDSLVLASDITDFEIEFEEDSLGQVVDTSMKFTPKFSYSDVNSATVKDGTLMISTTLLRNMR